MQIIKILNNNAVISKNKFSKEIIVIGKGIGYAKKVGDKLNEEEIRKTFIFDDNVEKNKLFDLINRVPLKYIETTIKIVNLAENKLSYKLSDAIYSTLLDHLVITIQRFNSNFRIKNVLLDEIQQFYFHEWQISLLMLKIINLDFNINLPEDEAGFLVMHLINNSIELTDHSLSIEIMKFIKEIVYLIEKQCNIKLKHDDFNYRRLVTHLKFFSIKLKNRETKEKNIDKKFYKSISASYPKSFQCSLKIKDLLMKKYEYQIAEDDLVYLTIHIEKIMRN